MKTTFDRFYPTHPGEVLKDELEERGISQRKFAESIGMGYSVLNEILNGKRPITTTSALMFERNTALYQMLQSSPRIQSPVSTAFSAIKQFFPH